MDNVIKMEPRHFMIAVVPCAGCLKIPNELCEFFARVIITHSVRELKEDVNVIKKLGKKHKSKCAIALSPVFECDGEGKPITELGKIEDLEDDGSLK